MHDLFLLAWRNAQDGILSVNAGKGRCKLIDTVASAGRVIPTRIVHLDWRKAAEGFCISPQGFTAVQP